jgi:glyoxylase-like metal-dependent hydrolase (beta-lactamase superfamily II)
MAERVISNVWRLRLSMGYTNAYLLVSDDGVTLVDSGTKGQQGNILEGVSATGRTPADLKHILITHHHTDHTGSLASLVETTGAKAYVHPLDAPITRGDEPVAGPNPDVRMGWMLKPLLMRLQPSRMPPVAIEREVVDGDELAIAGGVTVIHTPGHTAGHVSYFWPQSGGVLFAGDAAGKLGSLGPPVGGLGSMFTDDPEQAKESFRKLSELEFDTVCMGHGGVLTPQAHVAFRRAVEKMAR